MIFIVGGAGFIGHSFVNFFLEKNPKEKIIVLDSFVNSRKEIIEKWPDNVKVFVDDVLNIDKYIKKFGQEIEYIFHAACSQISKSYQYPEIDLNSNLLSTLKIIDSITKNKVKLKRFIYFSSVSIYGNSKDIQETSNIDLHCPYSISKFSGEQYIKLLCTKDNIPFNIIRLSNVYGYNQKPINNITCGVIGLYCYNVVNDIPLIIYGDGSHKRDYTFIEDVLDVTYKIMTSDYINEDFNISSGKSYSTIELIDVIKNVLPNYKINTIFHEKRNIDNVIERTVLNTKLKKFFSYNEKNNLESNLKKILNQDYNLGL